MKINEVLNISAAADRIRKQHKQRETALIKKPKSSKSLFTKKIKGK